MKVGEDILNSDPEISKLAEDMAAKCNGLSLVLITIGSTMASRNDRHEWVRIWDEHIKKHPITISRHGIRSLAFEV